MHLKKFKLFNADPGAAGGAGAAAPAPAAAPAAAPADPAAAAAASAAPAAAPAPAPAADGGSALSAGGATDWTVEAIPEKYRVKGEGGELDVNATLRKVDEHRAALERRMGAGDIRPKTADDYKLEGDQFKALGLDAAATADFRKQAHEMGLSQTQFEGVMAKYAELAPGLVNASAAMNAEQVLGDLGKVWPDKEAFDANLRGAHRAATVLAKKANMTPEEVDAAIGNNPAAIRLLAALAPELGEDSTPASAAGAGTSGGSTDLTSYLSQGDNWTAYSDPKHIRHAEVTAQASRISQAAAKRNGGA